MDLASVPALTNEEFEALQTAVLIDQRRRFNLRHLPEDLADMARNAAEAGCDRDELLERVTDALTTEGNAGG